ncbi:unnamed protein product [Ambrosiozyma monospora]|uniref:Altered inheritance of mitochondria protein 21 n=1 Tax=Ambrosiozyma monospora TaxID=43982 RepID=A0A9W6Z2Q8_AMBMO|nr:unnamed protein product [Ambrosiozyma monospora]
MCLKHCKNFKDSKLEEQEDKRFEGVRKVSTFPDVTHNPQGAVFALPGLANADHLKNLAAMIGRGRPDSATTSSSGSITDSGVTSPSGSSSVIGVRRATTMDNSELEKEGQKLNHITKGRAKGPKRRLPKTVSSEDSTKLSTSSISAPKSSGSVASNISKFSKVSDASEGATSKSADSIKSDTKTNIMDNEANTLLNIGKTRSEVKAGPEQKKKTPPPIRKSSRKVSLGGDLFL